jgi:urease accessory protein UreE
MLRRLLSRFTYRLALSLNNPEDVGGLFRGALLKGLPPGRGLWGEDGSTVQFPLLDKETEGIAQNRALAAAAARLSQQYPPDADHFGKLRLEPLPGKVLLADAQAYGPAGKPGQVLVGVGGDVLACQWIGLHDQPRLAIVGSARSGRTNSAICMARTLAMNGGSVLMTGARLNERHRELGQAGVKLLDAGEAVTVAPGDFDLIVVDDADQFPVEAWLTSLAADRDQALVFVTGWDAPLGNRPVPAFVKSAAVQVVLRPDRTALRSGNSLGVAVPAETRFGGPAGRACVIVSGEARMVQVPWPGA